MTTRTTREKVHAVQHRRRAGVRELLGRSRAQAWKRRRRSNNFFRFVTDSKANGGQKLIEGHDYLALPKGAGAQRGAERRRTDRLLSGRWIVGHSEVTASVNDNRAVHRGRPDCVLVAPAVSGEAVVAVARDDGSPQPPRAFRAPRSHVGNTRSTHALTFVDDFQARGFPFEAMALDHPPQWTSDGEGSSGGCESFFIIGSRQMCFLLGGVGRPALVARGAASASLGAGVSARTSDGQGTFDASWPSRTCGPGSTRGPSESACSGTQGTKAKPEVEYTWTGRGAGLESWASTRPALYDTTNAYIGTDKAPTPTRKLKSKPTRSA